MQYEHIFFDLDNTLWDLDKNSHEALSELIDTYDLCNRDIFSAIDFIRFFKLVNEKLWEDYRKNLIDRETLRFDRFRIALSKFQIADEELIKKMGQDYSLIAPLKTNLIPFAIDVLEYLQQKYQLHIISNGFEEIQLRKMKNSGLYSYFKEIITADNSGYKKPDARIFQYAIEKADTSFEKSIMIGDDLEPDVWGAKNAGMAHIYFNRYKLVHEEHITHEIFCLSELKDIL